MVIKNTYSTVMVILICFCPQQNSNGKEVKGNYVKGDNEVARLHQLKIFFHFDTYLEKR